MEARFGIGRTWLFAAVLYVGSFALLEGVLWLAGVPTQLEREDPFRGFSGLVTVFERQGDVHRTRPANTVHTFNDQSFLAEKPGNGLRIFTLGGSSAFGFPWGAEAAFTRLVGDTLAAAHPERHIEAVNASGTSYAMHRLNLGNALFNLVRLDEAVSAYESAHRLWPDDAVNHNAWGRALQRQGRLDAAVARFQEAVRLDPGYAEAHRHWGAVLADLGRRDEAVAHYREALRLAPGDAEAKRLLEAAGGSS